MYIKKIRLKNVRCIKEIDIDLSSPSDAKKWLVLVGNNGMGKSSFLCSLAMGLCDKTGAASLFQDTYGEFIKRGEKEALIEITLQDESKEYKITTKIERDGKEEIIKQETSPQDFPWKKIFTCGYGANRPIEGTSTRERYDAPDALYTLFNYQHSLQSPELALRRIAKTTEEEMEICDWICEILLLNKGSIKLDDYGISLKFIGNDILWGSIADGYESTITVILDMLGWALLSGREEFKNSLSGILLIDEIEQHLHPELQRNIVRTLNKVFPNIQFITTSHSPLCAAALADLPDDNCSLELLKLFENHYVKNEPLSTMRGWRYDEILQSDAFGVPARNIKTQVLMDKVQALSSKGKLNSKQKGQLEFLLGQLEEQSPVGKEAAERRRLLAELEIMKQKFNTKAKEDDQS